MSSPQKVVRISWKSHSLFVLFWGSTATNCSSDLMLVFRVREGSVTLGGNVTASVCMLIVWVYYCTWKKWVFCLQRKSDKEVLSFSFSSFFASVCCFYSLPDTSINHGKSQLAFYSFRTISGMDGDVCWSLGSHGLVWSKLTFHQPVQHWSCLSCFAVSSLSNLNLGKQRDVSF